MRIRLLTFSLFILLATCFASAGRLYFVNTPGWAAPYAYCWNPINTAFPGLPMTQIGTTSQGNSVWSYTYADQANVIFSDNGSNQTGDLTILAGQAYNLQHNTWYSPENLYIQGTMTAWENRTDNKFSEWDPSSNTTIVTWSKALAANTTYDFKITYFDGVNTWYRSDGGTMTVANHGNSGWWFMGDGGNTQIQTTRAGTYVFKYDWAENKLYVEWPSSECTGSGLRHFDGVAGTPIEYKVEYADGKIEFTAWAIDPSKTLDFLEVQWWNSAVGRINVAGTAAGGVGTYTLNLASYPALTLGSEIYFRFHYGIAELGARFLTSNEPIDNTNAQTCYIRVGDCLGETDPPCMTAASLATNGSTSVVLNVSATDGTQPDPSRFIVTEANSLISQQTLTAAAGQITIDGLTSCTDYTFRIVARDNNGNLSSDNTDPNCRYREVTFTTTAKTGNLANGGTASASYLPGNQGEQPEKIVDGNTTGTAYTSWGHDLPVNLTIDIGALQYVNKVRIYWGSAYSADYEIQVSQDNSLYTTVDHRTTAPAWSDGTGVYQDHDFSSTAARYIRIKTNTNNWIRVYELEVYGTGECYSQMDPPTMISAMVASQTSTTVTLNVSGEDDLGDPTLLFEVGGEVYTASAGQITIENLTPCTTYNFTIHTLDRNGTSSSDNAVVANQSKTVFVNTTGDLGNMSLGKTATGLDDGNLNEQPSAANDGNYGTRYATYGLHEAHSWLQIDLGAPQLVKNVRIYWETACSDDYEIQFSMDGVHFNTVYHQTAEPAHGGSPTPPTGKQDHILVNALPTQYVKVVSNHYTGGRDYFSIWEMEIYGEGDCYELDDTPPTMVSAIPTAVTSTSVTLAVAATDDKTDPVWLYEINGDIYEATAGTITISGLTPCTFYSWDVYAVDNSGNRSTNYITTVSTQTGSVNPTTNLAIGKPATSGYEANEYHTAGRAVDGEGVVNANAQTRWGTQGRPSIDNDWIQVDLMGSYYIDSIKIQWETARPLKYQIMLSLDGTNWRTWQYNTAPTFGDANNHVYEKYLMSGVAARYVKVKSLINYSDYGISIWELEVYGSNECYTANNNAPEMLTVTLFSKTSTEVVVDVTAQDDITDPIVTYVVDGLVNTAVDGKLTFSNLSACEEYTWRIYAMDEHENISSNYKEVTVQLDAPTPGSNLALLHPVYSGYDEGGFPKGAAVDGDRTTRWATTGRPTSNDEWLVIDLEGTYKINRIEVEWEYGTSINYEFKNAYDASFGPNVIGGNTFDQLATGHFATFDHRNEQPEGSKPENFNTNEKSFPNADHVVDTYDYTSEQIYGRYIKLESGLRAEYATSLWEIRVYGECAEEKHIPVMQWAETVSLSSDAAEIYVSALDYETSEANMRYKVYVTGGESGYKQLTSEYTFTPAQFAGGKIGHLDIGGLIPGVPYEARIYAIDEDDNLSENYKTLLFTTVGSDGCVFSGTEAYRAGAGIGNASTQIFQKGYRVTVTGDENSFTIVAYTDDDFYELDPLIVQLLLNPADPANSGIVERAMTAVPGQDRTYTYTFNRGDNALPAIRDWTGEVTFFIKYPFRASGICLTYPITYDIDNGCAAAFIIFHHDDKPTADAPITYAGGTIDREIRYYRNFNAGIWEDLTMPFAVDSILVYDPEDHRHYKLTAQYNNGSTVRGKFLLRKQVDNVSGEDFVPSWYDGDTPLPQLNQPYAIRFTSTYYAEKYVLFCGHKNQTIAADFTKGTNPGAVDQYMVYGNTTMMPQSVGTAYLLPADHSDETYRRTTDASVRPFETYVLASAATMSLMPIIAPWRGNPQITTDIINAEEAMQVYPSIEVFSITGQRIGLWQNATILDVQEECQARLPLGCYVLSTTGATVKMIVR